MLAAPLLVGGLVAVDDGVAQSTRSASLEGSWRGGGSVAFASGQRERAECRAHYYRASGTSYTVTASCAPPSGRA
ncbi:MAG: hypothetical protein J2P50_19530, partial [Hyphomicrobiaceae bacterium]|nr:hypothetical protein [Hyphomicrobiaceae bacterium]